MHVFLYNMVLSILKSMPYNEKLKKKTCNQLLQFTCVFKKIYLAVSSPNKQFQIHSKRIFFYFIAKQYIYQLFLQFFRSFLILYKNQKNIYFFRYACYLNTEKFLNCEKIFLTQTYNCAQNYSGVYITSSYNLKAFLGQKCFLS